MASGPRRARDGIRIQESGDRHRDESNATAAAAATAAAEPPPPAPPSDGLQERAHGPSGAEGRNNPSAAAIAAARKGKMVLAPSPPPSPTDSEGTSSSVSSDIVAVSGAEELSSADTLVDGRGRLAVSWKDPLVEATMEVPKVTRHVDLKEVFDSMLLEQEWAEAEEMERQQLQHGKPPAVSPEKAHKKTLWSKFKRGMTNMFLERMERQMHDCNPDSTVMASHVNHQTIPVTGIIEHYKFIEMIAGRGVIFHSNALNLRRAYSEFRPVHGDGECFYRSFIFSYLEQVLDRQDTHEEHRLLATVKRVARHHARLGWTSDFSWRYEAFKMLIKKVMGWKRHNGWKNVPTTDSFRKQKLLEFFSGYCKTNDIFAFLRLVAAIWICSHSEQFEPLVPELTEGYTLRDWCFREVIRCKVFTDHIQMTALVTALGVPLRVEYLLQGACQDLYTGQDSQDDTPRTCWPIHRRQLPHAHVVPHVTVLYTNAHYDIIYPHRRDSPVSSIDESCSHQTGQVQRLTAESSGQPSALRDVCSGENSSQHFVQVEISTGENSDQHAVQGESTGAHEYDEQNSIAE